jgi:4-hydroxythreonine-4-phosphate dehydrogenase
MKRLLITTGDPDGVGSEVACKALEEIGPQPGVQFVLWRSPRCPTSHLRRLDRKFQRQSILESDLAALPRATRGVLIDIVSKAPPGRWVEAATRLCLRGQAFGIVTGPLSKTGLVAAGMKDRGHTEIFARLCRADDVFMAFWGRHFKLLLLTDHTPLMTVGRRLTSARIHDGLRAARQLRSWLGSEKPIALVGLNPHAGETGRLGSEETKFRHVLRARDVHGPLVPDTAFLPANWRRYSLFVCPYHDQGLIPFKLVHGFDEGVHLTLGLPFVRTSVDHGTAKDIFGRNRARHGSMRDAIRLALRLGKRTAR